MNYLNTEKQNLINVMNDQLPHNKNKYNKNANPLQKVPVPHIAIAIIIINQFNNLSNYLT